MSTGLVSSPKKSDETIIERLGDDIRKARGVLADLQRQIREANLVLDVPKAEARLAEVAAKLAEIEQQAKVMVTSATHDASAIKARGTLDAAALVDAATQQAGEIVSKAEGRATTIVEEGRLRREADNQTSNSRIHLLEQQAQAVLQRVQRIHAEQLALEEGYIQQRKTLLERSR